LPTPTTDIPIELQRTPNQAETDLKFIQRLARRNGFVFYVAPLTIGTNEAYFGPDLRAGILQPAINVGLGPSTNADSLDVTTDSTAPVSGTGTFYESTLGVTLPIPPLPSLKLPPLTSSPVAAKRTTLLRGEAHQGATRALAASAAAATNAPDPVQLTGTMDGVRYGTVLRARNLVGVRGAGATHDGIYFVSAVTHRVARGGYTQQFTLKREGTGALLPVVRPS
jgi:phage protein D